MELTPTQMTPLGSCSREKAVGLNYEVLSEVRSLVNTKISVLTDS